MTYLKEIHIEICNELSRTRTKMASSQMRGFVWKSAWFCMEICVGHTKRTGTLLGGAKMVVGTAWI